MFSEHTLEILIAFASVIIISIIANVLQQILFKNPNEPPVVFHWLPFIGSTVTYGIEPFKFFFDCQKKYGDIFTFILLGRKVTVYLGTKGNQFILNGKLQDLNAEEIYSVLTTPVFGKDVVYDVPNAKFMEQKKFIKSGLSTDSLRTYVPLMEEEIQSFLSTTPLLQDSTGILSLPPLMAQITIFTASRTLQGAEVRSQLDSTVAALYHDLDDGFQPINFMAPWLPLPANRRRNTAQRKMTDLYASIISARRSNPSPQQTTTTTTTETDMLSTLMTSTYKSGHPLPPHEIAGMMLALLMAGQHSSSVASSWTMLQLAAHPSLQSALLAEQASILGSTTTPLTLTAIQSLPLLQNVLRETLRLHPSIHSIMRKPTRALPVPGTGWTVPASHVLLASPAALGKSEEVFPEAEKWDPYRWEKILDPVSGAMKGEREGGEKVDYGYGLVSSGRESTYLPFGAGRHRCIGEQFATVQLGVIVSVMVRWLRLENVEGKGKGEGEVVGTDYSSLFARPLEPAPVRYTRRETPPTTTTASIHT